MDRTVVFPRTLTTEGHQEAKIVQTLRVGEGMQFMSKPITIRLASLPRFWYLVAMAVYGGLWVTVVLTLLVAVLYAIGATLLSSWCPVAPRLEADEKGANIPLDAMGRLGF